MDAEALNKSAGIVVLFRAFVIEERAKMRCKIGMLLRARPPGPNTDVKNQHQLTVSTVILALWPAPAVVSRDQIQRQKRPNTGLCQCNVMLLTPRQPAAR